MRSRRSDRNAFVADAAPLRRAPLFLEDVGLGVDLQAGVGQAEAARERADRDEHGRVARVFGALDRHREDVVFLEQLDGPLGAARRRRHEQRRLAVVAKTADFGDPVGDAALQLDRRLAADVARRQLVRRLGPADSARVVVEPELRELPSPARAAHRRDPDPRRGLPAAPRAPCRLSASS